MALDVEIVADCGVSGEEALALRVLQTCAGVPTSFPTSRTGRRY
jgi:hypothetical protein